MFRLFLGGMGVRVLGGGGAGDGGFLLREGEEFVVASICAGGGEIGF